MVLIFFYSLKNHFVCFKRRFRFNTPLPLLPWLVYSSLLTS